MALIPPFYIDCVAAIGTIIDGKTHWLGTGFLYGEFVEKIDDSSSRYYVFLVTNKHVIANHDSIVVRFNPQNDQAAKDYPLPLKDSTNHYTWTGHPDPEIDVAVILVNVNHLREENMKFDYFKSDQNIALVPELIANGSSEGDFIFVLGFPMGIVSKERQHVFVRSGVISRINDLFEGRSKDFVVDAFVFPGNSGGPVVTKPEIQSIMGTKATNKAYLIGMVKSYIPYQDVAISQQTNRPRIIFEDNSGLTKVEPIDHIIATIDAAKKKMVSK